MSKLDELIAELCPDGVEFVPLKQIAEVGTGSSDRVNAVEDGKYPFYVRSKTIYRSNRYLFDEESIVIPGEGGIGDIFHYVNGKYDLHQRAYRIHFIDRLVDTKFAYHYLSANFKKFILMKAVNATVTSIRKPMIQDFPFPLPPLPVQQEIVRILDKFTELTTQLTAELKAEIEARKKQYEYYRDWLLSQEELNRLCPDGVEYVSIGNVVNYEQPSKYIVKSTDYSDEFSIPVLTAGQSFILGYTNEIDNIYKASKENPVIIFDDFTGAFKWVDFPFKVKSSAIKMLTANSDIVTLRYIYHVMGNIGYSSDEHKRLWISIYSAIKIPVPPLPVQQEIVRILDNFTESTAELTVELETELEARQKQYEYYRDKLLTFPARSKDVKESKEATA